MIGRQPKWPNEQVLRNKGGFPADFMFQLTKNEVSLLRSQIATSKNGRGGRRYCPYVFTEHGAIMAASVLNSSQIDMSKLRTVDCKYKTTPLEDAAKDYVQNYLPKSDYLGGK
jgi:hypothetical protein